MAARIEIFARGVGKTTESELSIISAWNQELFAPDKDIIEAFIWEDKRGLGFNIQSYLDDELVGFAHVFVRKGLINDSAVLIGGLGSVMTATKHQGSGIGSKTVEIANDVILRNFRADLGVLLCKNTLVPFYEKLWWRRMQRPVIINQPPENIEWPHEAMILLRHPNDNLPNKLDLCGLPF